jgi:hypothetical protein
MHDSVSKPHAINVIVTFDDCVSRSDRNHVVVVEVSFAWAEETCHLILVPSLTHSKRIDGECSAPGRSADVQIMGGRNYLVYLLNSEMEGMFCGRTFDSCGKDLFH